MRFEPKLLLRKARGWLTWWDWKVKSRLGQAVCRFYRCQVVPIAVGMGFMSPYDALKAVREAEGAEEAWKAWFRDKTFLGADSDHPDGVYAEGGGDLVCMTCDEYEEWYGGRGDSRRGQPGA